MKTKDSSMNALPAGENSWVHSQIPALYTPLASAIQISPTLQGLNLWRAVLFNPFRVGTFFACRPRVARASQPWAIAIQSLWDSPCAQNAPSPEKRIKSRETLVTLLFRALRTMPGRLVTLAPVCLWMITSSIAAEIEQAPVVKGSPVRYVIGLSPYLEDGSKNDIYRRIVTFLLEDAPLNSSLWIYDAYHLQTITQVEVPDMRAFRSAKTRANQFKDQIQRLKAFLAAKHEKPALPPALPDFPLNQAIRFPQFLDFVGENLTGKDQRLIVMLIGSPLYLDPKEPGFSMVNGYFPSDGHLLGSRQQSVFGLKARNGALKDLVIHQAWFGDPWVTELHQEKVNRFWTLYLKGQGARLATFCGDLPTVFNAVRAGTHHAEGREQRYEIDPGDSKIQMLRITRDIGVADWITRDLLPNLATAPPLKTVGPMPGSL
jgi:hypothetical protein